MAIQFSVGLIASCSGSTFDAALQLISVGLPSMSISSVERWHALLDRLSNSNFEISNLKKV